MDKGRGGDEDEEGEEVSLWVLLDLIEGQGGEWVDFVDTVKEHCAYYIACDASIHMSVMKTVLSNVVLLIIILLGRVVLNIHSFFSYYKNIGIHHIAHINLAGIRSFGQFMTIPLCVYLLVPSILSVVETIMIMTKYPFYFMLANSFLVSAPTICRQMFIYEVAKFVMVLLSGSLLRFLPEGITKIVSLKIISIGLWCIIMAMYIRILVQRKYIACEQVADEEAMFKWIAGEVSPVFEEKKYKQAWDRYQEEVVWDIYYFCEDE